MCLEDENAQLKAMVAQCKGENAQLKGEVAQLKGENQQLKNQNAQLSNKYSTLFKYLLPGVLIALLFTFLIFNPFLSLNCTNFLVQLFDFKPSTLRALLDQFIRHLLPNLMNATHVTSIKRDEIFVPGPILDLFRVTRSSYSLWLNLFKFRDFRENGFQRYPTVSKSIQLETFRVIVLLAWVNKL